jgi:UDPglucose--hexose-1-phosphate uridylyltransferase
MAIKFRKEFESSKLLNPADNFEEKVFPIEFRTEPLTKDKGIVLEFRGRKPERADLSQLIAKSLEVPCPFCPEVVDKATPKFPPDFCPEGRIKLGEAAVFPNAFPFMPYSALAIVTSKHFVGLSEFTESMLTNAFLATQTYFKITQDHDPRAKYHYVMWNYMPPANSSQIHPHLQLVSGYFALTHHKNLLDASRDYTAKNGTNYWSDFIAEEKRIQERYIATSGNLAWLTSFVSRAPHLDILAIFQGRGSFLSLPREDIENFCQGLTRIFKYMDDENFYSFNLCLYSGTIGEDSFWTQARIIQRGTLPPVNVADIGNLQLLLDTNISLKRPESVCQELKRYFT